MVTKHWKQFKTISLSIKILSESFHLYFCCVVNIVSFSCKKHKKKKAKCEKQVVFSSKCNLSNKNLVFIYKYGITLRPYPIGGIGGNLSFEMNWDSTHHHMQHCLSFILAWTRTTFIHNSSTNHSLDSRSL